MPEKTLRQRVSEAVRDHAYEHGATLEAWLADDIGMLCADFVEANVDESSSRTSDLQVDDIRIDDPVTSFSLRRELRDRVASIIEDDRGRADGVWTDALQRLREAGEDYLEALEVIGLLPYAPSWRVLASVKQADADRPIVVLQFRKLDEVKFVIDLAKPQSERGAG